MARVGGLEGLFVSARYRACLLVNPFVLEPDAVQMLIISIRSTPAGAATGFPQLQASIRAYACRISGSLIGRSGNSRSMLSSVVLFLGPHPFLSAIARISPMHTTDVKEISRWARRQARRPKGSLDRHGESPWLERRRGESLALPCVRRAYSRRWCRLRLFG